MSAEEEKEVVLDLSNDAVCTKYTTCAEIVNAVMKEVIDMCKADADIATVCAKSDELIVESVGKVYNKKVKGESVKKGVAFPTCISPNNFVGHVSPMVSESFKLKAGDLVKIDLGAHIDGFVCQVGHTVVIPGGDDNDRKADVTQAAWAAAEAAIRTCQVGKKNSDVTAIMNQAVEEFGCNMVQGVLSHQSKQHVIDGSQVIIAKETVDDKIEEFQFGNNEVYCLDILVSTDEGKPKETEMRTTVYKRDHEMSQMMRTKSAREVLHTVSQKSATMPFNIRALELPESTARAGISEIAKAGLCDAYPVLKVKEGEFVAQFKMTCLLLPSGTKKVTGLPFAQKDELKSQHEVKDEELKALLATSLNPKKKKNNKK